MLSHINMIKRMINETEDKMLNMWSHIPTCHETWYNPRLSPFHSGTWKQNSDHDWIHVQVLHGTKFYIDFYIDWHLWFRSPLFWYYHDLIPWPVCTDDNILSTNMTQFCDQLKLGHLIHPNVGGLINHL